MRYAIHSMLICALLAVTAFANDGNKDGSQDRQAQKRADIRKLLQQSIDSGEWPAGMTLRVDADIWMSEDKDRLNFRETWEFTANRVEKIGKEERAGKALERREAWRTFDTSSLCRQLLDGGMFEIAANQGPGEPQDFALTDFDMGSRSIRILVNGESAFRLGESCAKPGYREPHARAFATLYERLASQARAAFVDFKARQLLMDGRDAQKWPQGMVLRLGAKMWKRGAANTAFDEGWEFTATHVHRVVRKVSQEKNGKQKVNYRSEASRPFESSRLCQELLDGRIFAVALDESIENSLLFAGTDYDFGGRYLELLVDGKPVFDLGEHCAFAGYGETHARDFAALYEQLASQARKAFDRKSSR